MSDLRTQKAEAVVEAAREIVNNPLSGGFAVAISPLRDALTAYDEPPTGEGDVT